MTSSASLSSWSSLSSPESETDASTLGLAVFKLGYIGSPYMIFAIWPTDVGVGGTTISEGGGVVELELRFLGYIGSPYMIFLHCDADVEVVADPGPPESRDLLGEIGLISPSYFLTTIHSWTSVTRRRAVTTR